MKLSIALVLAAILLFAVTLKLHLPIYILLFAVAILVTGLVRIATWKTNGDFKGEAFTKISFRNDDGI